MSEAEAKNKALVRRLWEADARGDLATLDELLAPDFVDHSVHPDQASGREGYMQSVAEDQAAFSGIHITIEYQAAADGDRVVSRLIISGLHDRGEYFGLASTGREWETTAIIIHRLAGGKIAEEWSESRGILEAMRQRLEQESIERERVEQELQVARLIQQASLPIEVPTLEGWQISPGHDLPLLRRPNGEAEELRVRGMPLGLMPGMGYEEKEVVLEGGESVLFYSDGLVEAHGPKREMFGLPRLVAEHDDREGSLVDLLIKKVYSFAGDWWEQEDDITLLTLKRSATRR